MQSHVVCLFRAGLVLLAAAWHPGDTPCVAYFCLVTLAESTAPSPDLLTVEVTKYNPPFQVQRSAVAEWSESLDWASWIVNWMSWALVLCVRVRRSCRRHVWCCLIRRVLRRTSITRSWCSPAALELDAEDSPRRRSPSALQVQPSDGED